MDAGLWHQPGRRGTSRRRRAATAAGTVLGAGLPLGLAAVRLLGRRRREEDSRDRPGGARAGS